MTSDRRQSLVPATTAGRTQRRRAAGRQLQGPIRRRTPGAGNRRMPAPRLPGRIGQPFSHDAYLAELTDLRHCERATQCSWRRTGFLCLRCGCAAFWVSRALDVAKRQCASQRDESPQIDNAEGVPTFHVDSELRRRVEAAGDLPASILDITRRVGPPVRPSPLHISYDVRSDLADSARCVSCFPCCPCWP